MTRKDKHQLKRRDVLRATTGGIVGAAAVLTFGGTVTADDGTQRFIVQAQGNAKSRIQRKGFEVAKELAGNILFVDGHESAQNELEDIGGVQHVVPNMEIERDTVEPSIEFQAESVDSQTEDELPPGWNLQWPMHRIDLLEAHEMGATGDGTRIAIVDTGIHSDHVDLVGNVNEEDSVSFGFDGERNDDPDEPIDVTGHGTCVGGIAAAHGENFVLGVAPDAELVSVRIFPGPGFTTSAAVLAGWDYVAREIEVDAMNFSVGRFPHHPRPFEGEEGFRGIAERLTNEIVRGGTLVAASTGNESANTQHGPLVNFYTDMAGVTGVGATTPFDTRTHYSDFGLPTVSAGAPGGGLETFVDTWCGSIEYFLQGEFLNPGADPGDETGFCFNQEAQILIPFTEDPPEGFECYECTVPKYPIPLNQFLCPDYFPEEPADDSYIWANGTSMASPIVAGIAALVRETNPSLHPRQVERAIKNGAELVNGESDPELGAGRVNAANTIEEVK